ncbi:MAG TPA: ATP-binding protein, partial [Longimicrobium sp.]|nr:ATP-binding protein [Longimicrobium sp.]
MAPDPYRYFRLEARELLEGLTQGVLALERGAPGPDGIRKLLRLAHTLKGAARVVKQPGIADAAHALEDALEPYRDGHGPAPRAEVETMVGLLDRMRADLAVLDPRPPVPAAPPAPPAQAAEPRASPPTPKTGPGDAPQAPAPAAAPSPAAEPPRPSDPPIETVRVELSETDTLLEGLAETGVRLESLRHEGEGLDEAHRLARALAEHLEGSPDGRARALAEELAARLQRTRRGMALQGEGVERELARVRDHAERLRLVRADAVFPALERAAHDAARSLRKQVDFSASGGEHRLDGHVLGAVRDALAHVVRNAVDHGLEPEEDRLVQGKSNVGRVELRVERRGGRVAFLCRDDGRGVDVEAVRQVAVTHGVVPLAQAQALSEQDLLRLLLRGGLTTARQVTQVSGRGVGLDVVHAVAERFNGEASIRSEPGQGTTVELVVPVSLSSMPALLVEAGGVRAALPLDAVQRTLRLAASELSRSAEHDGLYYDGEVIPFAPLAPVLGAAVLPVDAARPLTVVVLRAGTRLGALGVERLAGIREVYMKPVPPLAGPLPAVAGVSLDAEGLPQPMLDPK